MNSYLIDIFIDSLDILLFASFSSALRLSMSSSIFFVGLAIGFITVYEYSNINKAKGMTKKLFKYVRELKTHIKQINKIFINVILLNKSLKVKEN